MRNNKTRLQALTALFVALELVSAKISIPLPGLTVAFTAQVCVTLCAGLMLGPRYGALSQAMYLALGLIGLPVFSLGGGPGYVLHPSFAYLLGFPAAAWTCGRIAQPRRSQSLAWQLLAALAGIAAMYAVALPSLWLQARLTAGTLPALGVFLRSYCLVFLPLDIAKAALAAVVCRQVQRRAPGLLCR